MLGREDVDRIAGVVRAASATTEARFVDIGQRLEASTTILGTLTETFASLSSELEGENLQLATQQLSQIADRVAVLAQAHGGERSSFERLAELTGAMDGRLLR